MFRIKILDDFIMEINFTINQDYLVIPKANLIIDHKTGKKIHLEARIMKLLVLLAQSPRAIVTRDELVSIIWQDYGGGNEGLTQSISIVRKILRDNKKELIQTIPKKGYMLNASVVYETEKTGNKNVRIQKWPVFIFLGLLIIIVSVSNFMSDPEPETVSAPKNVPFPDNLEREELLEETAANTVITEGPDQTLYKLVVIGDRPPKFYINNKRITEDKWEPYMGLINSLKRKLRERKSEQE